MKQLMITITSMVLALFKKEDKSLDDALIRAVFGDRYNAPIHIGDAINIKSTAPISSCGTTGDIFATATMVKAPDGSTDISVLPPHFFEFVPVSADDKIVKQSLAEVEPAKRKFYEEQAKMLAPIKVLDSRRRWLSVDMAVQMMLTGVYAHHNGTIRLGFTNREELFGINAWTEADATPVEDVISWFRDMKQRPDAYFMDVKSYALFKEKALSFDNQTTGKAANFHKASFEEQQRKSISDTVIYKGTIIDINLDVFEVTSKKVDTKGNKTPMFGDYETLFVPLGKKEIASFHHMAIPQVEIENKGLTMGYKAEREIVYSTLKDNKTQGGTYMMSIFMPLVTDFDYFAYRKVA